MAIFGTLNTVSLADTLALLQRRTGILVITDSEAALCSELFVEAGELRGLEVDYRPIVDPTQIREHLAALLRANKGRFHFIEGPIAPQRPLALPLRQLVLEAKFAVIKARQLELELPHPQTRFRVICGQSCPLEPALNELYEQLCARGEAVSAEALAHTFGYDLKAAQLALDKLRTLGLLAPLRAFERSPAAQLPAHRPPSLIRRLLNTLRQL